MSNDANWFRMTDVTQRVFRIEEPCVHPYLSANMYFVRGRDVDLLVDTGMGLVPLAPALPLTQGKPLIAMATHIHLDHVGSLHEFAERAGPRQSAAAFATMPAEVTYEGALAKLDVPVTRLPSPGWTVASYAIRPAPLTRILDERDRIDLGNRLFRVLHLPGHSPDSIALFDEHDGTFLSGDAICDDQLIDDLPDSDRAAYRLTMQRILELPVRAGYGGHGPVYDGARMRKIAQDYLAKPLA
jgi:glyoxylase-like metal-dependent hydrolase (beta-lactamase superfamily II)